MLTEWKFEWLEKTKLCDAAAHSIDVLSALKQLSKVANKLRAFSETVIEVAGVCQFRTQLARDLFL